MNVVTLIQARMTSTRLPQKVMLSVCGKPLLKRMYERVKLAQHVGEVVIITSAEEDDDPIIEMCMNEKISFYRGNLTDLLERHYKAALQFNADVVVKIPSDCPLIDPVIIDKVIKYYKNNHDKYDYVSNLHPATYPDGNDVEVMSFTSLEKAYLESNRSFEREHTTPYIWENPSNFRIGNIIWENGLDFSSTHRWTIDYEEDYILIRSIYEELMDKKPFFTMYDILNLLEEKPYLKSINQKYAGKYWYENHLDELNHIDEFKNKINNVSNG
jgi:spore coat polysaccharide biosynthesis protein SpsF